VRKWNAGEPVYLTEGAQFLRLRNGYPRQEKLSEE
jgi:hypothetical protein